MVSAETSETMRRLALLCALSVSLPALAQTARGTVYCCTDGGHQVCGDVLPPQCFGKSYKEMSPQGTVRRIVEAPLTPEQVARKEAEERERRAEMRRNQSLLETYSSVADIDARRDRAIEGVQSELKRGEAIQAQLQKKRAGLLREAEFYQKRAMPAALAAAIRDVDSEIATQGLVIDSKRKDIESIRNRYEQDRTRYIALTEARNSPPNSR